VRGVSRAIVTGCRAYNCATVFICSSSNNNSVRISFGDMNNILNHAVRLEGTSAANSVHVDVLMNVNSSRAAVLFQDTASDNDVEFGVLDTCPGQSANFGAATARNSVTVERKLNPVVHASGLASESVFNGTTTNSFELRTYPPAVQLVIATGVVTVTNAKLRTIILETEGSAATDDLDTISGDLVEGRIITLRTTNSARDVVVRHNTGNILLSGAANYTLSDRADTLMLIYNANSARWCEIGRGDVL
jgi:hypothetical protein